MTSAVTIATLPHREVIMPKYNSIDDGPFTLSAHTTRSRWVPLKKKWPFFTGDKAKFRVEVSSTSNVEVRNLVFREYSPDEQKPRIQECNDLTISPVTPFTRVLETRWLHNQGQHWVTASVDGLEGPSGTAAKTREHAIFTFDVKSSDTLVLIGFGIAVSLFIGLAAATGGWALNRWYGDDSPQPVYIVEPPGSLDATPGAQSPE